MSEKYEKIMGKIEVTEEMRRRVLLGVQNPNRSARAKIIPFPHWKRYLTAAAGFIVIISCIFLGFRLFDRTEPPPVQTSGSISVCTDVNELTKALGFPVADITALPFGYTESSYTSFWGRLGQIIYTGADGQRAVYRKSAGNEDNTGDYNTYADTAKVVVNSAAVTLKGEDGLYSLAWWSNGEYSYSLNLTPGVSESVWTSLIADIQ